MIVVRVNVALRFQIISNHLGHHKGQELHHVKTHKGGPRAGAFHAVRMLGKIVSHPNLYWAAKKTTLIYNELPKTAEVMEGIVHFNQLRYDPRYHLKDYVVCAARLNEELDEIGVDMIPEDELFQKISKEFKLSHYMYAIGSPVPWYHL